MYINYSHFELKRAKSGLRHKCFCTNQFVCRILCRNIYIFLLDEVIAAIFQLIHYQMELNGITVYRNFTNIRDMSHTWHIFLLRNPQRFFRSLLETSLRL